LSLSLLPLAHADSVESAYKNFRKGKFDKSLRQFWEILQTAEEGSEAYESANYFIGQSLFELGFHYGASEYFYTVVRSAGNTEFIDGSIAKIQEMVEKDIPFDSRLLIDDLIFSIEYAFLPPDLNDFVNFEQGVMNHRHGYPRWAKRHFDRIQPETYYAYRVKYIDAVELLKKERVAEATKILQEIVDAKFEDIDLKSQASQTIARLLYEKKEYEEALAGYMAIDSPLTKQASVFMEKGWTQYFLKDYQLSLGALHALGAPIYKGYFDTERYIISMLIYKEYCMYEATRMTLSDYQKQYGDAVKLIKTRGDLAESQRLLNALFWSEGIKQRYDFLQSLNRELEKLQGRKSFKNSGLRDNLVKLYELKIKEMKRTIKADLYDGLEAVSERLLDQDEQLNLLTYEVRLDELKRVKLFEGVNLRQEEPLPMTHSERIYWNFDNEYWSDEMPDYRFLIQNECKAEVIR
jgi:hypothetical protein